MDRHRRRPDREERGEPAGASSKDADFLKFVYDVSSGAKVFAQSWDQALQPDRRRHAARHIGKLFQLSISPQQFADTMNATIGK